MLAHVRRKFFDLHQARGSPVAAEAIRRIGALYAIETSIRGKPPQERQAARDARASPLLVSLHGWLQETLRSLSQKSALAEAIRYALKLWAALVRYTGDGRIEIDNNAAERSLRAVAVGRKNYLFAGSDAGGERAAAIYSLIGSAKLNGLDPEAYLHFVIERIAIIRSIGSPSYCLGQWLSRSTPQTHLSPPLPPDYDTVSKKTVSTARLR